MEIKLCSNHRKTYKDLQKRGLAYKKITIQIVDADCCQQCISNKRG